MIDNLNSAYPLGTGAQGIKPSDMGVTMSQNTNTDDPEKLMEICKEFESIFINIILKQARSGINVGELTEKSHAREIFEEMQDEQMAINMSKGQGIGLAQQLYRQLSASSNRVIKNQEENINPEHMDTVDKNTENVDNSLNNIKDVDNIINK